MNYKPYGTYAAIAIAVISVTSIVASGCGGSSHSSSPLDQTQTLSNLKQVGLALAQYTEDYDEKMPNVTTAAAIKPLLMPYIHDSTVFVDSNNNVPFAWNASLAGGYMSTYPDYSMIITFYDAQPPVSNSIPVELLNGQAHLETTTQFNQLKVTSGIP